MGKWKKEKILITVRTYPVPSSGYMELVCTGGITDTGEWRRLFPVPLRYLEGPQQYRTYDIIEVQVKNASDGRPESHNPNLATLKVVGQLSSQNWLGRCDWVNPTILPSLEAVKNENRTIAPVAVSEVIDFMADESASDWTPAQQEKLKQAQLFDEQKPLEKIPYAFRFIWKDGDGIEHKSLILSWEVCETWRRYRQRYSNPIEKMREKWLNDLCGPKRDVSFFVGNLASRRSVFTVCGIFSLPKEFGAHENLWTINN